LARFGHKCYVAVEQPREVLGDYETEPRAGMGTLGWAVEFAEDLASQTTLKSFAAVGNS
jgi:hypothetical protein